MDSAVIAGNSQLQIYASNSWEEDDVADALPILFYPIAPWLGAGRPPWTLSPSISLHNRSVDKEGLEIAAYPQRTLLEWMLIGYKMNELQQNASQMARLAI